MSNLFTDFKKFAEMTGMIFDHESLLKLSLTPCTALGIFQRERIEELAAFCAKNPTYHIVSQLNPNVVINRLSLSGTLFFLADGDDNKNLIYDLSCDAELLSVPIFRAA